MEHTPGSRSRAGRFAWLAGVVAATALVVVAGVAIDRRDGGPSFEVQPVVWGWCPGYGVECALLAVPIDHTDPEAGTIAIEVARRPALDTTNRVGVLVVLPGGPGGDGTIDVQLGTGFSEELRDRFDIVSYNPRGFSPGTEVDCGFDESPPAVDDVAALRSYTARRARACAANAGPLAAHLSAVDVARDVDVLRRALGEERISLLGISYGTAVGAIYQTLFADHVRTTVLDGGYDLRTDLQLAVLRDLDAAERSLEELLRRCARYTACPFHNGGRPREALVRLLDRLAAHPPVVDGRAFTVRDAEAAILEGVGWNADWPELATALAAAQRGDPSQLAALGRAGTRIADANLAFACGDRPAASFRPTIAQVAAWRRAAPLLTRHDTAATWAVGLCDGWPYEPTLPPEVARATAPTLVVAGTGDTRTPLAAGRELARELGAPILVVQHFGHTAYTGADFPEPTCVTDAVDTALLGGALPETGTVCPADAALEPAG